MLDVSLEELPSIEPEEEQKKEEEEGGKGGGVEEKKEREEKNHKVEKRRKRGSSMSSTTRIATTQTLHQLVQGKGDSFEKKEMRRTQTMKEKDKKRLSASSRGKLENEKVSKVKEKISMLAEEDFFSDSPQVFFLNFKTIQFFVRDAMSELSFELSFNLLLGGSEMFVCSIFERWKRKRGSGERKSEGK